MATTTNRLRRGLNAGHSIQSELKTVRRLKARVYLDEQVAVKKARKEGLSWADIGDILGMSESWTRRHYMGRGIH